MNQNQNEQVSPFSTDANMFADDGSNANEAFTAFSDTPMQNTPERTPKKKKKKAGKVILTTLIIIVLLVALLIGSVIASPLIFKAIGDSKVKSGDYAGAQSMYSLCLGFYDTKARKSAAEALITATGSEGLEAGISEALESGLKVHLVHDLNGGRFINSSRQEDVVLDLPEQFATLYKATKEKYDFTGWSVTGITYHPDFDDSEIKFELKADFTPTVYTISYTNLHSDEQTNPTEYTCETNSITLNTPSRKGYTFISWSGSDIDGETGIVVIPQGSSGDRAYIANWSANKYTVEFNPDVPCDIEESMIVTYNDAFKFPKLEKRGYRYKGWSDGEGVYDAPIYDENGNPKYDENGNRIESNEHWTVDHDVVVTPVWELINYKLNYDLGGGSMPSTPKSSYTVHDEAFEIPNPTRHGYTFLGWTFEGQTTALKNVKIPANSINDRNFKANWAGNKHTLTLDANGGTSAPAYYAVVFGSEYSVPTPVRTGYTFGGWYSGDTQYSKGTWNVDEDMKLTAKWTANQYKLSFNTAGGGNVNPMTVTYDNVVTLPTLSKTGYNFLGWYNGNTQVTSGTWKIANNVTLTAKWQGKSYTVSLNANGGTTTTSKYTVNYGSAYTLPKATRPGYKFLGWYNGSTQYPTSGTWTNDGSVSLTAKWEIQTFTIAMNPNGGKISGSAYMNVNYGEYYSLPTPTRDGYIFLGWLNGTKDFQPSGYYKYDTNVLLVAQWTARASTVTLNANGGTVSTKTMMLSYGKNYTLPTPTRKGYTFAGWYSGHTKFSNSGVWKTDGNITLTAKWEPKTYRIWLDANGGSVSKSYIEVRYGEYYTLPTPSKSGHAFIGWASEYLINVGSAYSFDHDIYLTAFWYPLS